MVMNIIFLIIIVLFIGSLTGRAFNILPLVLILLATLFLSFGVKMVSFILHNPWLLFMIVVYFLFRKKTPKKRSGRFYYYSSKNAQGQKDFEEFFRQAGGYSYSNYQNGGESIFTQQGSTDKDYENLGTTRGVSKEEIKKAYRDKVKMHHPDRYTNASEKEREYHEAKIKEINESYEKITKELN